MELATQTATAKEDRPANSQDKTEIPVQEKPPDQADD